MAKANDYDRYAAIRQKELINGGKRSHRLVEKPAMESLLPDLSNKRVLMLGCGTGEESLLLEKHGGSEMVGVDFSAESIKLANESYPNHQFLVGDMNRLGFGDGEFDFVYSSLTVHYSENLLGVYREIYRVLKPGGFSQFSTGHPMRWSAIDIELEGRPAKMLGFTIGDDKPKLYGSYSSFRKYRETFESGEILEYWIGPPSMHFALLKQAGFTVEEFVETKTSELFKESDKFYYGRFSNFPQFVIFVARKS